MSNYKKLFFDKLSQYCFEKDKHSDSVNGMSRTEYCGSKGNR